MTKKGFKALWIGLGLMFWAHTAMATQHPMLPKNIVIFLSHEPGMPWQEKAVQGMASVFKGNGDLAISKEFTGLSHHGSEAYNETLTQLYRLKFAQRRIDLILAVDVDATHFVINQAGDLFKGIPLVFISESGKGLETMQTLADCTGTVSGVDIQGTLDAALAMHPGTRQISVISGTAEADKLYETKARNVLSAYTPRFEIRYLSGLSMAETLDQASCQPPHTILLYLLTLKDGAGHPFIPREVVKQISEKANAPLYGLWDTFLGSGIVGGRLSSAQALGGECARMALRVLKGEKPAHMPIAEETPAFLFDDRQLKKWHIRERRLPRGSQIRFREASHWQMHQKEIITAAVALILESGLILLLWFSLKRRREAEKALKQNQDQLEHLVDERTEALAAANLELRQEIAFREQVEETLRQSELRYRAMFENHHAVMLIIDPDTAGIVVANPAACRYYGYSPEAFSRLKITDINLLPPDKVREEMERARNQKKNHFNFRHRLADGSIRDVEVYTGPIQVRGRSLLYSIVHDVSDRKRIEKEKEKLINELQQALAEVTMLSGLLPICASCKKIRDDQGYWKQLETYIEGHSQAKFSHSLCGECSDKLYGKEAWYQRVKDKRKKKPNDVP